MYDDFEFAQQLVKSIRDAESNDQAALAASLRETLAEVNERLIAAGFAAVTET